MTELLAEDLTPGTSFETRGRTVTESDVVAFAGLSWDLTAVHTDAEAARASAFGERVAHGSLIAVMAIGLGNLDAPATANVAGVAMSWTFAVPVKIGDTIRARWCVDERHPPKRGRAAVTWAVSVVNQHDVVVQTGTITRLVRCREPEPSV